MSLYYYTYESGAWYMFTLEISCN